MKSIICILSILGLGLAGKWQVEHIKPTEVITYKKDLTLHVFRENTETTSKLPAIIFFFGGAWKSGSVEQFYAQCEYFKKRGGVSISAQYRTAHSHGTDPSTCVKDGKSAVRWVKLNADRLGIDPEKIILSGGSAGGHVAAAVATTEGFNAEGEDTSISCVPEALVLFNPVYDNGPGGYGHDRVTDYWEKISPAHNITADTPPTITFFGTNDIHLKANSEDTFQSAMKAAGVRSDLHLYEGEKHGFFNFGKNNNQFFNEVTLKADSFLISLGLLDGKPNPSLLPKLLKVAKKPKKAAKATDQTQPEQ